MAESLLMTTAEAAKSLRICEKTLRNLVAGGRVKPVRIGTAVRFAPSELARFIDASSGEAVSPPSGQ